MYPLHPLPVPSTPSLLPHFHPLVFNTYKLPVETSVLLCAWRLVDYQSLACVLWTGLRTVMQNKMSCLCVCPLSTGQARQGKAELIYIYIWELVCYTHFSFILVNISATMLSRRPISFTLGRFQINRLLGSGIMVLQCWTNKLWRSMQYSSTQQQDFGCLRFSYISRAVLYKAKERTL
jgi:hypothetical protein